MINKITLSLNNYPMEELKVFKQHLLKMNKKIFDFGIGDPQIPLWSKINETIVEALTSTVQYPSIRGIEELREAQKAYMKKRFGVVVDHQNIELYPTSGSKEAIFHVLLSIIEKDLDKKYVIYPNPGYPVYKTSILFAGGVPYPMEINESNNYLLEPWTLPLEIQQKCAAIWVNYPHNPTGYNVSKEYWEQIVEWANQMQCMILSDECYVDIYNYEYDTLINQNSKEDQRPQCALMFGYDNVVCFHSLSKRSGFTGYRSGFMVGDAKFLKAHFKARSNFGISSPEIIQKAATIAWADEEHVKQRRKIFSQRMKFAGEQLQKLGMLKHIPNTTFYLWCKIPLKYNKNDVKFCKELAYQTGIIVSPSSWLGENVTGYCRFALIPSMEDIIEAINLLTAFVL